MINHQDIMLILILLLVIIYCFFNEKSRENFAGTPATSSTASVTNPYLGQFIKYPSGSVAYVDLYGKVRPVTSSTIRDSVLGKKGCPTLSEIKDVTATTFSALGTFNPPLVAGTNVGSEEACIPSGSTVPNPFLNKYIRYLDGKILFVDSTGKIRQIDSLTTLNAISGKNGCPASNARIQLNTNDYTTLGLFNPPLTMGTIINSTSFSCIAPTSGTGATGSTGPASTTSGSSVPTTTATGSTAPAGSSVPTTTATGSTAPAGSSATGSTAPAETRYYLKTNEYFENKVKKTLPSGQFFYLAIKDNKLDYVNTKAEATIFSNDYTNTKNLRLPCLNSYIYATKGNIRTNRLRYYDSITVTDPEYKPLMYENNSIFNMNTLLNKDIKIYNIYMRKNPTGYTLNAQGFTVKANRCNATCSATYGLNSTFTMELA